MIKSKRLVLFGFVLWFGATQLIFAQTAKKVLVYDLDGEQLVKYRVKSVQECILIANELQSKYQEQGFLGCSVDTVYFSDSVYIIQFFQGIAYQIKSLTIDDPLKLLTNKLKIKQQQPLTLIFYNQLLSEIKQTYNNNGYALAEVNNSNTFESDQCILWFKIEPGLKYQYGEIRADEKIIQTKALKALIGINEGDVFNQRKVNEIPIVINNTGYLQLDSIKTTFSPEAKANIRLEMSSLKTNSISGLIGIAPSPDNKTSLTGELNFKLVNSLKQGEYFDLTWRKSGIGSQYLKMESNYPYINGKNVGVAAGIEMDKQDTTFISTEWNTGLVTTFARSSRLIFSYSNFKSNRIDTTNDQFGMVKSWLYGGQLIMNRTNFRLNPSSGFTLMALLRFGQHNLKKGKLEKSNISKFGFEGRLFIPIKHSAIVLGNNSGLILADTLYKNEMYRIGGEETLRGVNDRSIFASNYTTWSVEYRWLYEKLSNFYLFADYTWLSHSSSLKKADERYAIGAGIHLNTKAGLIYVSYAMGNTLKKAPDPASGIIHMGLISSF